MSGFYVGHAVYVRIEVVMPWRLLAYYCDSFAACHVIHDCRHVEIVLVMLTCCVFARVSSSSSDILRRICYQGLTMFGCGVEETQGKQVNR